jgi:hypothetical protein
MLRDEGQRGALAATLALCRQLAVSYAGLTLLMGMFPQVRASFQPPGAAAHILDTFFSWMHPGSTVSPALACAVPEPLPELLPAIDAQPTPPSLVCPSRFHPPP